jgi:hypothetical protein
MQHSVAISTRVAVVGGFLLLGLVAIAVWLLLSASPASAQTDETTSAPAPASTDQTASESPTPAPPDGTSNPPIDLEFVAPDLPPLPVDLTPLAQALPSVTEVLPPALQPALQPVVEDVAELLPAPVRAPVAPSLSRPRVAAGPLQSISPGDSLPPGTDASAAAATAAPHPTTSSGPQLHNVGALRPADSPSHESRTRAPPSGVPPKVAAQGSAFSSSAGRDLGQSLLLFGIVAAGAMLVLGRGRRLLIEALGWLPAPWCALIERPG